MKEYEYIVEALEGYLCDELTGMICSENYRNGPMNRDVVKYLLNIADYTRIFVLTEKSLQTFRKNRALGLIFKISVRRSVRLFKTGF